MGHRNISEFILEMGQQGQDEGQFSAVSIFVDLSGFTLLTSTLTKHGMEGAEVLAMLLSDIFNPLMNTIYEWDGFVVTLAGDAFIATFPLDEADAYERAVMAAWQINQHVCTNPARQTRFGNFHFSIKVSVAVGRVNWGLMQPAEPKNAICYFIGEAIDRCLEIDQFTPGDSIFLTADVRHRLPPALFHTQAVGRYWELQRVQCSSSQRVAASRTLLRGAHPPVAKHRSLAGEFRQVATVFVNFEHLWSAEDAPHFQQTLFRLIDKYEGFLALFGRVGSLDIGCTFLLFWGAPKNHENDLLKALRFVLELRAAAPMRLRVGLTYNLAYAGFTGSTQFTRYTCLGPYVNLAARQVMAANWGEILLDPDTARQVGAEFEVTEGGWRQFKGYAKTQQVFLLDQQPEGAGAPTFRSPMVGRQRALSQVWQAIQPLCQRKFGGIVLLSGEAGIGKSRLIYALQMHTRRFGDAKVGHAIATPSPPPIAWFHCPVDEMRLLPLNPFRQFLRRYFEQSTTEDEAVNRHHFTMRLDALILATLDRQLARALERCRPYLAAWVGLPPENPLAQHLESQILHDNWLEALKSLIKAASLRQPLIIHIEDAHWLDAESAHFINKLTHNVEGYPFLLLITMRTTPHAAHKQTATGMYNILAADYSQSIHLAPLDKEALHMLAIHFLEGTVTRALTDILAEGSQGNPFFAEQLMLYWRERDLLDWSDQGWCLRSQEHDLFPIQTPSLSPNARTVLTARLDRLPAELKEMVQVAAVLGREFDVNILVRMMPAEANVGRLLQQAIEANIWSAQTPTRYLFTHALLRDAAYDLQLRMRLRTLHRQAAETIEQLYKEKLDEHYEVLMHHYRHSGDAVSEQQYAHRAAQFAAAHYVNIEALQFVKRALELTPAQNNHSTFELLLLRAQIANILGDRRQQQRDLEALGHLVPIITDQSKQAAYYLQYAHYHRVTNDYHAALVDIDQARTLADAIHDAPIQMECHMRRGQVLIHMGDLAPARADMNAGLAIAYHLETEQKVAECISLLGNIDYYEANYVEAQARFQEALDLFQSVELPTGEINCLYMFSVILYKLGQYSLAQRKLEQALEQSQSIGWRHSELFVLGQLGNNYFDVGNYARAQGYHQQALALCKELQDQEGEAMSHDTLGLMAFFQGKTITARLHLHTARDLQLHIGDKHGLAYTLTHLGYVELELDDLEAALAAFHEAIHLRQEIGEEAAVIDAQIGLAATHWRLHQVEEAIAGAQAVVEWLATYGAEGIELPVYVCQLSHELLAAAASFTPACATWAQTALRIGHRIVQTRAAHIQEDDLRQMFLERIPYNRAIILLWQQELSNSEPIKESSHL